MYKRQISIDRFKANVFLFFTERTSIVSDTVPIRNLVGVSATGTYTDTGTDSNVAGFFATVGTSACSDTRVGINVRRVIVTSIISDARVGCNVAIVEITS